MKSHNNLYEEIISLKNLILAWKKARKGKTKKDYVKKFEENLVFNLKSLNEELMNETYYPNPLKTFILRDPKTRKISKSDFRDRVIHHALCNAIEPIFDKTFIYDSHANRKNKGTFLAIKRLNKFQRKITNNLTSKAYCFKANIKHYFKKVDRNILLKIIRRKIKCKKTLHLIRKILDNFNKSKGIPLGNLTSQFFANVYLNELDQFVKHNLKVKYYVRYVDDFVLLYSSQKQLKEWKIQIEIFLGQKLKLELHPDKSRILNLSRRVDFVGFRNFYNYKLLRKRNIRNIQLKINMFNQNKISKEKFEEIWKGWGAYATWANSHKLKKKLLSETLK